MMKFLMLRAYQATEKADVQSCILYVPLLLTVPVAEYPVHESIKSFIDFMPVT